MWATEGGFPTVYLTSREIAVFLSHGGDRTRSGQPAGPACTLAAFAPDRRAGATLRCADGSLRTSRYLDYAATAPALRDAADAALELLPYYGSIHRGAGVESRTSTAAYEGARASVASFAGAAPDQIYGVRAQHDRGAQPAGALPARGSARAVDAGRAPRQHASLAPARRSTCCRSRVRPTSSWLAARRALASRRYDLFAVIGRLERHRRDPGRCAQLAALAHRHGAEICVDAAQLAPHAPIDMQALGHRPPRALGPQALRARSAPAR